MARSRAPIWNILTALFLLATVCVFGVVAVIFINPDSSLNPFPQPTVPVAMQLPTLTPTPLNQLPPTWTPTPTKPPTSTPTITPTRTPAPPTATPTFFTLPTWTPTATNTPTPRPFYAPSADSPAWLQSPNHDCGWMGVGGQVVDAAGNPVNGITVFLGGKYEGKPIQLTTTTTSGTAFGDGGYEIQLADDPNSTKETLYVQLYAADGAPISKQIYFRTYDDCQKNLIRIDFVEGSE